MKFTDHGDVQFSPAEARVLSSAIVECHNKLARNTCRCTKCVNHINMLRSMHEAVMGDFRLRSPSFDITLKQWLFLKGILVEHGEYQISQLDYCLGDPHPPGVVIQPAPSQPAANQKVKQAGDKLREMLKSGNKT